MTPRRPPYWTLPAFVLIMALPAPWSTAALVTAVATGVTARLVRALARRMAARRPAPAGAAELGRAPSGRVVALSTAQLAAHGLILGASGAGKSTTLLTLLTEQVRRGGAVVALDLKGSPAFAAALSSAAAAAGRPFLLWTPDGPTCWNPLGRGNATILKDKLIATERFTEPHYQRAAERYLQMALTVSATAHPGRAPTLAEVVSLCDPRRLAVALRSAPEAMRAGVQDYLSNLTFDQLSAVRGLATRLAIITESHTGAYLQPGAGAPEIDLPAALRGEAVVLFSLNSSSYGKLAAQLGTLVVQDLVTAAGERLATGPPLSPALVAIDEFSALGAEQVLSLFARGREAAVSVVVATQELADLDRAAPGLREQVLGNTAVKVVHRQDVPASAQMASALAGTERTIEETRQFGGGSIRRGVGPRGYRREVERPLVPAQEIMTLRTGEAIVVTKLPRTEVERARITPPRGPELGR